MPPFLLLSLNVLSLNVLSLNAREIIPEFFPRGKVTAWHGHGVTRSRLHDDLFDQDAIVVVRAGLTHIDHRQTMSRITGWVQTHS